MVVDQHEAHLPAGVLLVGGEPVPPDSVKSCATPVPFHTSPRDSTVLRSGVPLVGRASGRQTVKP